VFRVAARNGDLQRVPRKDRGRGGGRAALHQLLHGHLIGCSENICRRPFLNLLH